MGNREIEGWRRRGGPVSKIPRRNKLTEGGKGSVYTSRGRREGGGCSKNSWSAAKRVGKMVNGEKKERGGEGWESV